MAELKVLLALTTEDNDYQREQASVAQATADRLGINLQVLFAGNDAIGQTKQILASIKESERPDVVVAEPVGTGMSSVAAEAARQGIGWMMLNREPDYIASLRRDSSAPMGVVVTDNVEIGRIQGRQFAALLPDGGPVLYIQGPATDVSKQRRAGLDETLPANIQVETARGQWTEESGFHVLETRLRIIRSGRPPNVGIVGCMNDAMAMGARKAVEAIEDAELREQWLKIPFTGVDGVPSTGKVWVQQRQLAATVIQPVMAGVALELVAKAVNAGTQVPEKTVLGPESYPALEELGASA
jgi:ABC-type sugar transport system substrate-binding protein